MGFVEVRTSPGRRTLTFPFSGGLATTPRPGLEDLWSESLRSVRGQTLTRFSSGAGSTKRMLLSFGDIPGLTSHAIHTRCPTLKIIDCNLRRRKKASEPRRIGEVDEGPHPEL